MGAEKDEISMCAGVGDGIRTKLIVSIEIPGLDIHEIVHFGMRPVHAEEDGVVQRIAEFVQDLTHELQDEVAVEAQATAEKLAALRDTARSGLEDWRSRLKAADEGLIKVDLAKKQMNTMRECYYKEITQLREQVHLKEKAEKEGKAYHADDYSLFDPTDYSFGDEHDELLRERAAALQQRYDEQKAVLTERIEVLSLQMQTKRLLIERKDLLLKALMIQHGYKDEVHLEKVLKIKEREKELRARIEEDNCMGERGTLDRGGTLTLGLASWGKAKNPMSAARNLAKGLSRGFSRIVHTKVQAICCHCSCVLLEDSRFCHKCGHARSEFEVLHDTAECPCGNICLPEESFCRKCGAPRAKKKLAKKNSSMALTKSDPLGSAAALFIKAKNMFQPHGTRMATTLDTEEARAVENTGTQSDLTAVDIERALALLPDQRNDAKGERKKGARPAAVKASSRGSVGERNRAPSAVREEQEKDGLDELPGSTGTRAGTQSSLAAVPSGDLEEMSCPPSPSSPTAPSVNQPMYRFSEATEGVADILRRHGVPVEACVEESDPKQHFRTSRGGQGKLLTAPRSSASGLHSPVSSVKSMVISRRGSSPCPSSNQDLLGLVPVSPVPSNGSEVAKEGTKARAKYSSEVSLQETPTRKVDLAAVQVGPAPSFPRRPSISSTSSKGSSLSTTAALQLSRVPVSPNHGGLVVGGPQ